eukprot:scaffold123563_cov51-Phaeocystis_antarctica.AAC.9
MAVLCSPGDLAAARHLRHHHVDDAGAAPHADQHLARTTGAHAARDRVTYTLTLALGLIPTPHPRPGAHGAGDGERCVEVALPSPRIPAGLRCLLLQVLHLLYSLHLP